ncbi:porin family protein [Mucilaginibacter sabulilitoris]|uniref:Porin family protein n=1 Tax=Mucilaginibacter sabulilitoris TaxID=1173583 RepID=A0ABZ0TU70_9SPHI|nr:porin family protein [Mucilaginibacter sabulilitoris]WPU96291.1 porin family protein [Mucilaginibacter sabulilitoris]
MNKTLTTIIIVLCTSTMTFAQQKKGDVELSFNTGWNVATVSNYVNSSSVPGFQSYRTGWNVGAAADFYFSNRWSLKTKLLFDQKGWGDGFFSERNSDAYPTSFNLNYITLPVMANWHFGRKRNWYLNFGPYAGYLAGAEAPDVNVKVKDYFHNLDLGLALGIGTKIKLADNLKLLLEYDNQGGITDIFKMNEYSAVRNSRGSINVGLTFILK